MLILPSGRQAYTVQGISPAGAEPKTDKTFLLYTCGKQVGIITHLHTSRQGDGAVDYDFRLVCHEEMQHIGREGLFQRKPVSDFQAALAGKTVYHIPGLHPSGIRIGPGNVGRKTPQQPACMAARGLVLPTKGLLAAIDDG